jgi:hypothetical protein
VVTQHEASRHFRNEKREYQKDKINELAKRKNKNIRDLNRSFNKFKKGYQSRNKLVKDENSDLLANSHILNNWKKCFSQLLNVYTVSVLSR